MSRDSLGDRIKGNYEDRARHYLTRRTPVMVRLDGRAFHTFTKGFEKPFDRTLINAMQYAAGKVAEEMMGCQAYYVQSDEASFLLTDYATHETQAWFDYNKSKIETISAAVMTAHFNSYLSSLGKSVPATLAYFDGRAFNIPKEEVSNAFIWRMRDWERNGLNMLAMEHFSHKHLDGKSCVERHAMLENKGVSWDNLPFDIKFGYFAVRKGTGFNAPKIPFTYWDIENQLQDWTKQNENVSLAPRVLDVCPRPPKCREGS